MATGGLAPELLQWLAKVLTPEYHNVNRTYSDVAALLHSIRTLSPKTNVYTHENGKSELLLCISGTLPVAFRGATYNIPIALWIPHQYPNTPPTALVIPNKAMGIRPTNHVDPSGRCYHPYLAYWVQNPDKSFLTDLCGQLKDIFSKEPPVYSKQPPPSSNQQRPQEHAPPPPRPPLPQEIESQRSQTYIPPPSIRSPITSQPPQPPPPPIKTDPIQQQPAPYAYTTAPHLYDPNAQARALPVSSSLGQPYQNNQQVLVDRSAPPALPQKLSAQQTPLPLQQSSQGGPPLPPLPAHPSRSSTLPLQYNQSQPSVSYQCGPAPLPAASSWQQQALTPHRHSTHFDQIPQSPVNRFATTSPSAPRPLSYHYDSNYVTPHGPSKLGFTSAQQYQTTIQPKPRTQYNILDAEDAGMLPTTPNNMAPPPLPPNPEKDHLLNEIAKALQQRAEAAAAKTANSLEQAAAQAEALAKTEYNMERERMELSRVNEVCEKDQRILTERIGMADDLIREVRDREAPNIDAVVVAPTVVHNQLYELVTDDMAIEDTIYVLGKALDRERITLDVFLKHTRALAREQFMKRALVKKMSKQIGMT